MTISHISTLLPKPLVLLFYNIYRHMGMGMSMNLIVISAK